MNSFSNPSNFSEMSYATQARYEALKGFNYEAIAAYMEAVNWKYLNKTATADDVYFAAADVCDRALSGAAKQVGKSYKVACGGFEAKATYEETGHVSLSLRWGHRKLAWF